MPPDALADAAAVTVPRPLSGLKILDLSNVLAGPLGTYMLAMLGAEVIKVERPASGDLARKMGTDTARNRAFMGTSYLATSAGKQSITLNLKTRRGQDIFRKLVAQSDAVVENYRPGTMAKLGLAYEDLRAIKPDLVYCAISGFGQKGSLSQRPAYDQIIQGMSGMMSLTGPEDGPPYRAGFVVCDSFSGAVAALATVSAILRARSTGIGAMIDVSMLESCLTMSAWIISDFVNGGSAPSRRGNDGRSAAPSGTFATKDGHMNIVCNEDRQFLALCDALGLQELKTSPVWTDRHQRFLHGRALKEILHRVLADKTTAEWDAILTRAGVPCGPILKVPEAVALPQLAERGFQKRCEGSDILVGGVGFRLEGETEEPLPVPPQLGQNNAAVYGALGLDDDALAALRAENVI